jgi:hypothetical protein
MKRAAAVSLVLGVVVAVSWAVVVGCADRSTAAAPSQSVPPATVLTAPAPAQPKAPAPTPADATISNAPSLAGSVVLALPALPSGETRRILSDGRAGAAPGDSAFVIDAGGNVARGYGALPSAGVQTLTIRHSKADGSFQDTTRTVAVTQAAWTLDAFPELVVKSLTQESVAKPGLVASVLTGGFTALPPVPAPVAAPAAAAAPATAAPATAAPATVAPATAPAPAAAPPATPPAVVAAAGSEPTLGARGTGIVFPANGAKHLTFPGNNDGVLLYRWSLVIFRTEAAAPATGSAGKSATLLCVNDGPQGNGRSGYWMPRLVYDAAQRAVVASYFGTKLHQLTSPAGSVAADGQWNVALTYRRAGQLFLRVNGQDCGQPSPTDSFSAARPQDQIESRIGDQTATSAAWALDGLWLGQSELSETVVQKMEAWALRRAAALPGGAAASTAVAPLIDAEDFPARYRFDAARYAAWKKANPKEKRLAFQGQPAAKVQPDRSGWVRVFADDFRTPAAVSSRAINGTSVGDSTYDCDAGKQIWYAPGTNSAVGGKAICMDGNQLPFKEAYVPDTAAQTLSMRLYQPAPGKDGKPQAWRNAQFTSVNAAGVGYTWAGAKGFRVRAKLSNVGPGVFPCPLWFYGVDHLFWRTGERIEFDIIELDEKWDNYGSSHVHPGMYRGLFGHSAVDTMKKSAPDEIRSLKLAAGPRLCGVNAWDGNFHTWEVWIEDKTTYINVDGLEVARVDTAPEYLERLYMYLDTSLRDEKGMNPALSYDLVLSKVEAFQPATLVEATPRAPFTARPVLHGNAAVGSTLTCTANLSGCDDVRYYWHSDGYPRGFSRSNTYTVLPGDAGAQIRCLVKAVGAKDQPEAWTAAVTIH